MSWEPLAPSDPIPGDPGQVAAVARQLQTIASKVESASGRLRGVTAETFWEGDAAQSFEEDKDDLPPLLDVVQRRYHEAGLALLRYAPELADAKELARQALAMARNAEADIAAAQRGVERMNEYRRDEQLRVRAQAVAYPDRPRPQVVPWSGPDYNVLLGDARADLVVAQSMLDSAIEQNRRAARAAADSINAAIHDDIRNTAATWAQVTASWLTRNLPVAELSAILGVVAAVAALLALILPGAGLVAFGAGALKLILDGILWAASDYDHDLGQQLIKDFIVLVISAGLLKVAASAASLSGFSTRMWQAAPTVDNTVFAARATRALADFRAFEFGHGLGELLIDGNELLDDGSSMRNDFRMTFDIYRSHPLLFHLGPVMPGVGPVLPVAAAAWLYHNAHRLPPPPQSHIAPISPLAPAAP